MEYQREINLLKQQIDFLNNKLQEQQIFNEENNASHEDNILELKQELEENFTLRLNEIMIEKKNLNEKIKESQNQKKEMKIKYEEKINEDKIKRKQLEEQIKTLIKEKNILEKNAEKPIQKINELLEIKSQLQSQNNEYKENIQNLIKENKEQYKNIIKLEIENIDLIQENENINNSLTELDTKFKSKIPNTSDLKKQINLAKSYNSKKKLEEPKNQFNIYNSTSNREKKVKINSKKK